MEQLSELDYSLLQLETGRTPNHISALMVYEPSKLKGVRVGPEDIRAAFECNLHKSRVFRRRLAGSTGGVDTPYWVEDAGFDLDAHLKRRVLPGPGNRRQLFDLVTEIHGRRLDLARPPWEAWLIEGLNEFEDLPPNSFALLLKVHHVAADGVAVMAMLTGLHNTTARRRSPPRVEDGWEGEVGPPLAQIWSNAVKNLGRRPAKLAQTLRRVLPEMSGFGQAVASYRDGFKTRFNQRVSAEQVLDAVVFDLAQIKALRQAVPGVTVNDVIVSVVGGALRHYLLSKGELPEDSLISSTPTSVRGDEGSHGNQVGMMWVTLATDIADPVARLRAVSESANQSKTTAAALGPDLIKQLTEGLWPPLVGGFFRVATLAAGSLDMPLPQHTVVSNIPGPRQPLYLAGARLRGLLGFSQLSDGMGLLHAVMSADRTISISFLSCRELMPDPENYRQCLLRSWEEMAGGLGPIECR